MNTPNAKTSAMQVLEKIKSGEVRMRPRIIFALRAGAALGAALLVLILSSLIASFVLFSLHETGEAFLLGFGVHGILVFVLLFPWPLLAIDIGLLFLLDWLLRGFSFGYRYSLVSVLFVIVLSSTALALLINATTLHTTLLNHADKGTLPVAGSLYEEVRRPHRENGVFRGIVVSVASSSFLMQHDDYDRDADDAPGAITVFLPSSGGQLPRIGNQVFVFGTAVGSTSIRARGVEVFPDEMK
jgi:hypothetical protein